MGNNVLTIEQVANELSMSKNLIYKQARTGKMPGWIRVGDLWLISRINLEKFINGECQGQSVKTAQ